MSKSLILLYSMSKWQQKKVRFNARFISPIFRSARIFQGLFFQNISKFSTKIDQQWKITRVVLCTLKEFRNQGDFVYYT